MAGSCFQIFNLVSSVLTKKNYDCFEFEAECISFDKN